MNKLLTCLMTPEFILLTNLLSMNNMIYVFDSLESVFIEIPNHYCFYDTEKNEKLPEDIEEGKVYIDRYILRKNIKKHLFDYYLARN